MNRPLPLGARIVLLCAGHVDLDRRRGWGGGGVHRCVGPHRRRHHLGRGPPGGCPLPADRPAARGRGDPGRAHARPPAAGLDRRHRPPGPRPVPERHAVPGRGPALPHRPGPDRPGDLHVRGRPRAGHEAHPGPGAPGRRGVGHLGAAAVRAGLRPGLGDPRDLPARRHRLPPLRPLRRGVDVGHRLPRAGPHPHRPGHAADAGGRRHPRLRRHRRHPGLVAAGPGHRRGGDQHGHQRRQPPARPGPGRGPHHGLRGLHDGGRAARCW